MIELEREEKLKCIITENEWLMEILRAVRECRLPDWFVGAGVIRSLVWDYLHGYSCPTPLRDVDVAFFDLADLSQQRDEFIVQVLRGKLPSVPWEVTNQAAVHLWFEQYFGYAVLPLRSVEEAVSTWPETATSIGVRLLSDDELHICAPFGLKDLMNMTLRCNPKRVTLEIFSDRITEKRISEKWPRVRIIDG